MLTCSRCGAPAQTSYQFCQQCGQQLAASASSERPASGGEFATLQFRAEGVPPRARQQQQALDIFTSGTRQPHRSISLGELFAFKNTLIIGRSMLCDICLPHPSVSRLHALMEQLPQGGLRLRDLDSVNGVLLDGKQIKEPVVLKDHQRVGIGPYLFCLSGGVLHALDSSQSLRLEAHGLEKTVRLAGGGSKKLLENINLAIEPGEFVSLLGPSGSGKSTLMDCLNGRRPATGGLVLANGEDFYLHFRNFRQLLGYVPQRDIVHAQLTVYRALHYTARLRLPTDTEPQEYQARIADVLRQMELHAHQETLVGQLSGGQIKRVSLGAELLARPSLLYIDEATSGLDAGTEARMMRLFRQLADEGRSVLCITHNVDNVDLCDLIVVLARGRLVFFGPPAESRSYFRISRTGDIYDRLAEKAPEEWEQQFTACSLHREFVAERLVAAPAGSLMLQGERLSGIRQAPPAPPPSLRHFAAASFTLPRQWGHQFVVLTARYLETLGRDRRSLMLFFLQAPIVAAFILMGFVHKPYDRMIPAPRKLTEAERQKILNWIEVAELRPQDAFDPQHLPPAMREGAQAAQSLLAQVGGSLVKLRQVLDADVPVLPDQVIVDPRFTYILVFLIVVTVLWFGCNNSAREIGKEEAIYSRERAVNLGIIPYVASKFVVLAAITALQAALLMLLVYGTLEILHVTLGHAMPPEIYRLGYLSQFGMLTLLSLTGVALGLALSACVSNPDRAGMLLPYVLIPQIILSGAILTVEGQPLKTVAALASPAYWAYRAVRCGETEMPQDFPFRVDYNDALWIPALALLLQTTLLLLLTAWFLRRKDATR